MNLTIIGCGWFGRALGQRGAKRGWPVRGSVRDATRAQQLRADGIQGFALDLSDVHYPQTPFQEAIVVIAVPPGRGDGQTALYEAGIARLLAHAPEQGARGIILISSTSVYEGFTGEVAEFTEPTQGENVLVRVELALRRSPIANCAVRFGGLIGPERHPGRFLAGRRDLPNGDHPVNLVWRVNCVDAIELLLAKKVDDWPRRINVVAPDHPTRAEYYTYAAGLLGLDPPTFLPESDGGGRIVRTGWLDSEGFRFTGLYE